MKVIAPLVKGELTGRTVLIPRSFWPEEECDGEGWPAVVKSEKYGVASVRTPPSGDGFSYHFQLAVVLEWRPLK